MLTCSVKAIDNLLIKMCRLNVSIIQNEEHRLLSLRAALQSMVLLKNTRQGGLPLNYTVDRACVRDL